MTLAASPETPAQTAPAAAPARARRRVRVGWVLLLLLTLLFMAIAFTLVEGLQQGLPDLPWAVVVNGQDLWQLLQHHMRSEDAQFGERRLAAEDTQQTLPFIGLDPVRRHQFWGDCGFGHACLRACRVFPGLLDERPTKGKGAEGPSVTR